MGGTAAARAGRRAWVAGVLVALPIMLAALAYQERGPGLVALGGSSVLAVLAVLRPVAGLGALLTVLPFVAFVRRALYLVSPYTPYDPLLLVAPALTGCLVVRLLLVDKAALRRALGQSGPARLVLLLALVFALETLNPLQENLLVGLSGALFFLAPVPWCFFGLLWLDRARLGRLLTLVVALAAVTALYGLGQLTFGFLPFEEIWIRYGGFAALGVGGFVRPFSTFANPEEWSRFLEAGAVIAFAFALAGTADEATDEGRTTNDEGPGRGDDGRRWTMTDERRRTHDECGWGALTPLLVPRRSSVPGGPTIRRRQAAAVPGHSSLVVRPSSVLWLALAALLVGGVMVSGVRSSVFGTGAGMLVALALRGRTAGWLGSSLLLAGALALSVTLLGGWVERTSVYQMRTVVEALLVQTRNGLVDPLGEPTVQRRLADWAAVLQHDLVERPLGAGLGVPTIGAQKFGSQPGAGTESYLFALVIGSGLPGAALFLLLAGAAAWRSATRALAGPRADPVALAVAAVLAALQLNNLFGNTFVLYAVAPLGWLLLGWTLQPVERRARRSAWPPPVASPGVRRGAGSLLRS